MFDITPSAASVSGLVAGAFMLCAFLPYVRDMILRRTQPRRSSWLIWAVVTSIAFFSQAALPEAGPSLWFSGAIAAATTVVFLLSLRFGTGKLVDRVDAVALVFSAMALALWAMTSDPGRALLCAVALSSVAGGLTVHKAFVAPWSETLSKWTFGAVASGLALGSVSMANPLLMVQPIYLLTLHVVVSLAILLGRLRLRQPA